MSAFGDEQLAIDLNVQPQRAKLLQLTGAEVGRHAHLVEAARTQERDRRLRPCLVGVSLAVLDDRLDVRLDAGAGVLRPRPAPPSRPPPQAGRLDSLRHRLQKGVVPPLPGFALRPTLEVE